MPHRAKTYDIRKAERKDLYTDFGKRIEFLQAFLNFTEDDVIIFNKGAKYLKAALPDLTHRLYAKMLDFDITARALRTRTTTSEGEVEDLFTLDSPHVQRRKIFWKWYLTRLFSDPSEIEYWEYLAKVGEMHTGKVLMHPLKIEYMHMNTCLGFVNQLAIETISLQPDMSITYKFALIRTLNKILCIQNDLISRCYTREGEEFETGPKADTGTGAQSYGCPHMEATESDGRWTGEMRSDADTASTDTRPITDRPDTASIEASRPNTGTPSIPDPRSERPSPNPDSRPNTANASSTDGASLTDTRSNSDASSLAQDRSLHPRCLMPGASGSQSRPTSSGRSQASSSSGGRERSASIDLIRIISSADTGSSTDLPFTGGHHISPSYAGTLPGFTSPFAPEQTFETKIWSAKSKQKWYKAAENPKV
ncbi:hypothetical protein BO70DRAFT_345649 [Aspergillus heteromorphus CBS 117.55]|uniref:Globin-sensor domain-containing protein n=1 Tax=Aspergillus heteromorphus CBS 117.55 TaxID=1448321 RepID=A0A317UXG2_9EURO|nr:uncharacterized protein BO70DRAFT_345649 [Aspergillus heteromorphus CBS 117.55]PWY66724.1 hypothetical protein BO70DRAFT_345649 [Aspergillus heteromorphus CBS 117.55]